MEELLSTNNLVTISVVESLLNGAEIEFIVLDQNMSILEGSIGIIPRRIMVGSDRLIAAQRLLTDAGLSNELTSKQR